MPSDHLDPLLSANCHSPTGSCGDAHKHSDDCGHIKIRHGDHFDHLVPLAGNEDIYEMHHECKNGRPHCHVHGVLRRLQKAHHSMQSTAWFVFEDFCPACSPSPKIVEQGSSTRTSLYVSGICCPSEVPIIERLLKPLPGVTDVAVNVTAKTTIVTHDNRTTDADLVLALNSASLGARIHSSLDENSDHRLPRWNVLLSGFLWALSMLSLLGKSDDNGDDSHEPVSSGSADMAANEETIWPWAENLKWIAIAGIVVGWPPILKRAFGAMKTCVLDINMLMTLAVTGAIAIGDYVEGAAVVFLFALSEWLETRAGDRARAAIAAVLSMKPQTALKMVRPSHTRTPNFQSDAR